MRKASPSLPLYVYTMIEFTELNITDDNRYLVIGVRIACEFKDTYLNSITVDNQDTYTGNDGSVDPLYHVEIEGEQKYFRLKLDQFLLGTCLNGIFFVKVTTKGGESNDIPCDWSSSTVTCTVANMYPIYQKGMRYIRELEESCSIPKGFIDFILKLEALELAIKTGNYTLASKYYRMFMKRRKSTDKTGGCNCGK